MQKITMIDWVVFALQRELDGEIAMSEVMSFEKFMELVEHIKKDHSVYAAGMEGKTIKYINPIFDMRGNEIFSITFRGFGWEHNLNCINENRDLSDSLFDRCMAFLDSHPY